MSSFLGTVCGFKRNTRFVRKSHRFIVEILSCKRKFYSRTSCLWKPLPVIFILATNNQFWYFIEQAGRVKFIIIIPLRIQITREVLCVLYLGITVLLIFSETCSNFHLMRLQYSTVSKFSLSIYRFVRWERKECSCKNVNATKSYIFFKSCLILSIPRNIVRAPDKTWQKYSTHRWKVDL